MLPILLLIVGLCVLLSALGYACGFGVSKVIDRIAESIQ